MKLSTRATILVFCLSFMHVMFDREFYSEIHEAAMHMDVPVSMIGCNTNIENTEECVMAAAQNPLTVGTDMSMIFTPSLILPMHRNSLTT